MLANRLLASLQWLLVICGVLICLGSFFPMPRDTGERIWVYTYWTSDGREVTARQENPQESAAQGSGQHVFGMIIQFSAGLALLFFGAILFCLRRMAAYMADFVELQQRAPTRRE